MHKRFLMIVVCLLHASVVVAQSISADRIVTAKPLFTDGTRTIQVGAAPTDDAKIRSQYSNLRPIFGSRVQINVANLIQDFSANAQEDGASFHSVPDLVSLTLPDGEMVYLDNLRVYEQQPGTIAWLSSVLTVHGSRIGSARFQFFENGNVRGRIGVIGRWEVVVRPGQTVESQDLIALAPDPVANRPADYPDNRLSEERQSAVAEWRERLAGPEYETKRRMREQELDTLLEQVADKYD